MNKKSKFRIFNSPVYLLGKIETFILIFIPLLIRDALSTAMCLVFCGFFALIWIYYMLTTGGVILVEADGICCQRPLKKPVQLKWNDIVCSGIFSKEIYGRKINFRYFSSKQLQPGVLNGKTAPPRLSESLIFAVDVPELDAAVKRLSDKVYR